MPQIIDPPRLPPARLRSWISVVLAGSYWLLESAIDMLLGASSWHDAVLPNGLHELWMRGFTMLMILVAGSYLLRTIWLTRRSEYLMQSLVESTSEGYLSIDTDWRITYVNDRAESLLGVDRRQVTGKLLWDVFHEGAGEFHRFLRLPPERNRVRSMSGLYAPIQRYLELHVRAFDGGTAIFFRDITDQHQRESELNAVARRLQTILDSASDGIVTIDQHGTIESFSHSAERIFGYRAEEVIGRNVNLLMPEPDASAHDDYLRRYIDSGRARIVNIGPREVNALRKDGSTFPMDLAVGEMKIDGERYFVGVVRDISERRRNEEELRRSRESLARAQQIAHLGSWSWDIASGNLEWSDEVFRIFGLEPDAIVPTYAAFLERIHPEDRPLLAVAVESALKGQPYTIEHRITRPDGSWRFVHEQGEVSYDESGQPLCMMGTVQDITERRQAQEAIEFMANFDTLTGLPNRSLMQYRLQQALSRAHRERRQMAVLLLDVDRFKTVNDTLGHAAGDALLKATAERLQQAVREGDTVARLGSDEFAVTLDGVDDLDQVAHIVGSLREAARQPLAIDGHELFPSISVGITLFPHDGRSAETLIRNADAALHRAKSIGPDHYEFFTADMTSESMARLQLEADLRRALERDEFELYYQPQVELGANRVIGFEALLRWHHPERGMVSPAQFIPVLEDTGLILPVGQWVLEQACRQARAWKDQGQVLRIAINLSALQFRQRDLVGQVEGVLKRTGLPAEQLELEITESLLVENVAETIETLAGMHQMGVQISIDDFGTGYSSMSYLQRFPVHTLKLDRTFVKDVNHDPDSAAIAKAVIALAHSLRLKVIAEGAETAEQIAFLKGHGCDEVQGFYYSKPRPAAEAAHWLHEYEQSRATA